MALIAALGGLSGLAYYLNQYNVDGETPENEKVPLLYRSGMLKDLMSTGIVNATIRPFYLAFTDLNEAFKPHSAPFQTPTHDLGLILEQYDRNLAYEQSYAPAFFFKTPISQISLSTAEQSNPNVIVPDKWSQPPGAKSLGYHPRAYYEYHNQELYDKTYKNRFTTTGYNTDAGMPTETEVHHVPPDAGPINIEFNPWGPGGLLQNLFNNGLQARTLTQGADLSTIIGPPLTGTGS